MISSAVITHSRVLFIWGLFAFCAPALVLAQTAPSDSPTLKRIQDMGEIRLAYRENAWPFSYLNENKQPIGYAIDLCHQVVSTVKKQLNRPDLKTQYVPLKSQRQHRKLFAESADIECGTSTHTQEEAKYMAFSVNYFITGSRLLVKRDSGIRNFENLNGKTVVSITPRINVDFFKQYINDTPFKVRVVQAKDHTQALALLEKGRAQALVMDEALLYGLHAANTYAAQLEIVGDSVDVQPYAATLSKNDVPFKKLVDGTLTGLLRAGEIQTLYKKWFLSPLPGYQATLNLPMSTEMKALITNPNDKPSR